MFEGCEYPLVPTSKGVLFCLDSIKLEVVFYETEAIGYFCCFAEPIS